MLGRSISLSCADHFLTKDPLAQHFLQSTPPLPKVGGCSPKQSTISINKIDMAMFILLRYARKAKGRGSIKAGGDEKEGYHPTEVEKAELRNKSTWIRTGNLKFEASCFTVKLYSLGA